ncbi:hypothetical protein M8J75_009611 [Diaphorina citri]|nr:hypothetical protein M8J75_009611 [Diaphorina citri]
MILLDIEKAFDKIWHEGLLYKLNIPSPLIRMIKSYLEGRTLQVKYNEQLSDKFQIHAGITQGSILGPTLFTIYIQDLPKLKYLNTGLYADDTALYARRRDEQPPPPSSNFDRLDATQHRRPRHPGATPPPESCDGSVISPTPAAARSRHTASFGEYNKE